MIVAKIQVSGVRINTVYRNFIPAGIIGADIEISYTDDIWRDLRKTVVFRGVVTKDVVTDASIVTIPPEVVTTPNSALSVGVYGVDADGDLAVPTLWADLGNIRDAANPSGDPTTDPSLPVWAHIESKIGNLDNLNTQAKENLVAAINEALTKGGGTVDEAEIQRIVDSYLAANPPAPGEPGKDGAPGADGKDGITPTIGDNGNWYLGDTDTGKPSRGETGPAGLDGQPGADGADGYSPTANVTQNDSGATITITDKNGTTTATVTNGKDGADGNPGADGSPGKDGANGADGKSAYAYAVEGGYTGTEAEFAAKLAQEKYANPEALTFTGAATGSYDGSQPLTVNIPSGGGGDNPWRLIKTVTLEETVKSITVDTDNDGNAFSLSEIYIQTNVTNREDQTAATSAFFNINGKDTHVIGTTSPMFISCGKTGETGRNWIWIISLNPLLVLHGTWITTNSASGKTVQCYQANEFNGINPNPFSVGEKITSITIGGASSTSYFSAGSIFRIYGR